MTAIDWHREASSLQPLVGQLDSVVIERWLHYRGRLQFSAMLAPVGGRGRLAVLERWLHYTPLNDKTFHIPLC